MVTIRDIAAKANVSLTTASMVLNNKAGAVRISEKTQQQVLAAASELGYVPNMSARQLRQPGPKVLTLALLLPVDSRVSMVGEMIGGIQQYLLSEEKETQIPCALVVETYKQGCIREVEGLFSPHRFNGAIAANLSAEDQEQLHQLPSKVPCVLLQRRSERYSYADAANYEAGRELVKHFAQNKHAKLFILVPSVSSDAVTRRVQGMQHELATIRSNSGVAPELVIVPCDFSEEGGHEAVYKLLPNHPSPTAVVCLSDPIAVGALSALYEAGVRVPEDCELMGFDNLSVSRYTIPKLSTVDVPVRRMAYEAARMLVHQIVNAGSPQQAVTFDMTLIHRETTITNK